MLSRVGLDAGGISGQKIHVSEGYYKFLSIILTSIATKALSNRPWFRATMDTWAPFPVRRRARESPNPVLPPVIYMC